MPTQTSTPAPAAMTAFGYQPVGTKVWWCGVVVGEPPCEAVILKALSPDMTLIQIAGRGLGVKARGLYQTRDEAFDEHERALARQVSKLRDWARRVGVEATV